MSESKGSATASPLNEFAAAVAHEIRTPLAAVAGEVEIALRRDRSGAEYREALRRIGAGISELVELSGDFVLLSDPPGAVTGVSASAPLAAILWRIRGRYQGRDEVSIAVDCGAHVRVAGDDDRLRRAITLVVEHALRHRKPQASVAVRVVPMAAGRVRLVVDAQPGGFWPHAWSSLTREAGDAAGPLRLRTARHILEGHGAALRLAPESGTDVVQIELPAAP